MKRVLLTCVILATMVLSACGAPTAIPTTTKTVTVSTTVTPQASSTYLQSGKTSFQLGQNEQYSVVVFLEEGEIAHFNCAILPTLYAVLVNIYYTQPNGAVGGYGRMESGAPPLDFTVGFLYTKLGGYYSVTFEYPIPPRDSAIKQLWESQLKASAPSNLEIYVSCELSKSM